MNELKNLSNLSCADFFKEMFENAKISFLEEQKLKKLRSAKKNKNIGRCLYCEDLYCINCSNNEEFCSVECQKKWNEENQTDDDNFWTNL